MRYLATVVVNCFLAFGEILQMRTRLHVLSGGVARVSRLLAATAAAQEMHESIEEGNIDAQPLPGAPPSIRAS